MTEIKKTKKYFIYVVQKHNQNYDQIKHFNIFLMFLINDIHEMVDLFLECFYIVKVLYKIVWFKTGKNGGCLAQDEITHRNFVCVTSTSGARQYFGAPLTLAKKQ